MANEIVVPPRPRRKQHDPIIEDVRDLLEYGIKLALKHDPVCKTGEGTMVLRMPKVMDWFGPEDDPYVLELFCYVLGPSRHYAWTGRTLRQVADAAYWEITEWVDEEEKEGRDG